MSLRNPMPKSLLFGLHAVLCAGLWAQSPTVSSVSISTDPPSAGLIFYVDGQPFKDAVTFLWPAGSKHSLAILSPVQEGYADRTQYTFSGWSSNVAGLTDFSLVTADPGLTWIKASFAVQYAVDLSFWVCLPAPQPCGGPGTVTVNGSGYIQNTTLWVSPGSTLGVQAMPNVGYIFEGWGPVPGTGNTTQTFVNSYVVNHPMIVRPLFRFAVPLSVTIQTSPPGLQVLLDRTPMLSPATVEWGRNTTHMIGAVTPQTDKLGQYWVFDSWSDHSAINHPYTVPDDNTQPAPLTAAFKPATRITFLTNPPGLKLRVDGRDNWPNYTFVWGIGSAHPVAALDQVDDAGNTYQFVSWSNGGAATQNFVASADLTQNRYTATFQRVSSGFMQVPKVPTIASSGIKNAAGLTPEDVVAPGSLVSVFGSSLAPAAVLAPSGPLPQTLDNVAVRIGSTWLPLMYVSPTQVNVQIPSIIPEGQQTLTLSWAGKPDTAAPFTVTRNAPGLFSSFLNGEVFAAASHEDGTGISPSSPARSGEVISLYATGLGPTEHPLLDGFPVPANALSGYMDPVYFVVGDSVVNPVSALTAPGVVGASVIQIRVDGSFPAGKTVPVKLRVNGRDSNSVLLPLQ